jgi:hypothetical protein
MPNAPMVSKVLVQYSFLRRQDYCSMNQKQFYELNEFDVEEFILKARIMYHYKGMSTLFTTFLSHCNNFHNDLEGSNHFNKSHTRPLKPIFFIIFFKNIFRIFSIHHFY